MRKYLIAETDEWGDVTWVWMGQTDTRQTKPLDPGDPLPCDFDECEIAGASRAAVRAWLQSPT
ncbi:MAG: hypothetical protein AAF678_00630 [Pseudomonadota bacterium]